MSPAMRLRFWGCANGLNRSCQQNEKSLARSLAGDPPKNGEAAAEPLNDVPEPQVQATLHHAQAKIDTYRNRLPDIARKSPSQQEQNRHLWGSAMMNALADLGMPVQAVHSSPQGSLTARSATAPSTASPSG
jgi:hypothetical protein